MLRTRARNIVVSLAALQTVVATGCYSLQPVTRQEFPAGIILSASINDAGRVALADKMGANITTVQGRLVQKDTAGYLLAVSEVETFRFGTQVWSGERIQIRNEYVNQVSERKFSKSKTALVAGAAIAVVAIMATQGILGKVSDDPPKPPTDTSASIKIPLFIKR